MSILRVGVSSDTEIAFTEEEPSLTSTAMGTVHRNDDDDSEGEL